MKMKNLLFFAGKKAYKKIVENGLSPDDVKVCVSASGAAKWLSIYGLDKAVFGCWLNKRSTPVNFFGTSIGAWKFAAACMDDPDSAFDRLADAYINQRYGKTTTPDEVSEVGRGIMESFIPDDKIFEILNHPKYRLSFSAARCRNFTGRKNFFQELAYLLRAGALNVINRNFLGKYFERTFFMDKRDLPYYSSLDTFPLNKVFLTEKNLKKALTASGSIPVVMNGVTDIEGAPSGVYIDGGMIDYHPFFDFTGNDEDIVLYHHFYDYLIPGWFDKKFFWRRAKSRDLENVLLLAPSAEFVSSLPDGRIPDRKDFQRLEGKDDLRISNWIKAKNKSLVLGEEFLEAVETGKIRDLVVEI